MATPRHSDIITRTARSFVTPSRQYGNTTSPSVSTTRRPSPYRARRFSLQPGCWPLTSSGPGSTNHPSVASSHPGSSSRPPSVSFGPYGIHFLFLHSPLHYTTPLCLLVHTKYTIHSHDSRVPNSIALHWYRAPAFRVISASQRNLSRVFTATIAT